MSYAPIPMVPGPTSLHPDVLAALGRDYGSGQIESDFMALYDATSRNLARIMGTRNEVALMSGEGMLALWGSLKSCLKAGDPVVSVGTGVFGDGLGDMAAALGCRVERVSLPYDSTIGDLSRIDEAVQRVRPVMITAVHCETPSGTLNPLHGLGQIKKNRQVPLFCVDAVSSLGGAPVRADEWQVDLLMAGSQKCLSAPPSLAMVGVSEAAWERMKEVRYQGYDSIAPFRTVREDGRCPYTPDWHGIAALHAATQALFREGLEASFARHEATADRCRAGLRALGLKLWPASDAVPSPTVTAALVPQGFTWPEWNDRLRRRGLVCAGSFGPMAGRVFRLGHMGTQARLDLVEQALEVVAASL